jgi:hypothetical protein
MKRLNVNFLAAIALACALPLQAAAADLFALSGKNSKGADVSLTVTDELAEALGMTEFSTKVVARGGGVSKVRGIEISKLLRANDLDGGNLRVTALDGYQMDVPRADVEKYPVLFALEIDGKRLTVREKGPAWVIYPVSGHTELDTPVYEARSVWQIKSVAVGDK